MDRSTEQLRTFSHLAGLLAEDFPSEVFERRVRVVVGDEVLSTPAGQALVLTVARLAPRLCHRIDFVCPRAPAIPRLQPLLASPEFSGESLRQLAALIWSDGSFTAAGTDHVDVVLGLGAPGDLAAGVEDGAAVVRADGAARVDSDADVYGALVAAGLASAQLSGRLYPEIISARLEAEIRMAHGPFGESLSQEMIELQRPFLAGVGAVGCATVYALIVTGATGEIVLLDPDRIKDSNLMRYILFDDRHIEIPKVDAASGLIKDSGIALTVEKARVVLQEYLEHHPQERHRARQVISPVDTYQARREIAGLLPRTILNAGTTVHDFTISRHGFADGYACLACLYPARPDDTTNTTVMAHELGLSQSEVACLQRTKKGLTPSQLERVAIARGLRADHYADYESEPIDSFYNKEFCATIAFPTSRGEAIAPLAHGSALAGFLLGQALTASKPGNHRHFRMNTYHGLNHPLRRSPRERAECPICQRQANRAVHSQRWQTT
jgi:hypothetical protein